MNLIFRTSSSIQEFDPNAWNTLAGESVHLQHEFFTSLEQSQSLGPLRGVVARYIGLYDTNDRLIAGAPCFLKLGNKREFGPEIQWLRAGLQAGCFSWPKIQVCIPFYPNAGPKLLTHPEWPAAPLQSALLQCLKNLANAAPGIAAWNVMHLSSEAAHQWADSGSVISYEIQSVWHSPGCGLFADYLRQLPGRKRYLINKERSLVRRRGFDIRILTGADISSALLHQFYEGFRRVCARYGGRPWLPESMFERLVINMPRAVRMITAFEGPRYIASVFCMMDRSTLHVETWSAMTEIPALCFELLCYQPMEYAFEQKIPRINAGPVGLHKTLRGYAEERVANLHWFGNPELRNLAGTVLEQIGAT